MPRVSFAETIAAWSQLDLSLQKNPPGVPHMEQKRQKLARLEKRAITLQNKVRRLKAEMLQASEDLRKTLDEGRMVESRLRASLKGIYGSTSFDLMQYGIRPHGGGRLQPEDMLRFQTGAAPEPAPEGEPEPLSEGRDGS